MKQFTIGSGASQSATIRLISLWMTAIGANPRLAQKLFGKITSGYGAGVFGFGNGNLYRQVDNKWSLIIHRDDVQNFIGGVEVAVKVEDPKGGVYAYKEVKGEFHCLFCKVTRKTEKGIVNHVEKEHGDRL